MFFLHRNRLTYFLVCKNNFNYVLRHVPCCLLIAALGRFGLRINPACTGDSSTNNRLLFSMLLTYRYDYSSTFNISMSISMDTIRYRLSPYLCTIRYNSIQTIWYRRKIFFILLQLCKRDSLLSKLHDTHFVSSFLLNSAMASEKNEFVKISWRISWGAYFPESSSNEEAV